MDCTDAETMNFLKKQCVKHFGKCPKIIETLAPAFCWGLLHLWALPTPIPRREGRERSFDFFPYNRIIRELYVKRLSRHKEPLGSLFHVPLDNSSAP